MNKQAVIDLFTQKYNTFIAYIRDLSDEEYLYAYQQKWTAGQQLEHIVLCVKPLVQVFSMDKAAIEKNFGAFAGPGRSYETLLALYHEKLQEGGKAPTRFVPETTGIDQRAALLETLTKLIHSLCAKIETFTEQELDTLCLPHPLLGNLTLREMLYNATYHVEHHLELAKQNLKNK